LSSKFAPAPVVLIVYNRLDHTRQTVEALARNDLAAQTDLFVYADAPKNPEAAPAVQEVRAYAKAITGFKSIRVVEWEKNMRCAGSTIAAITEIVNRHVKVISLDDDIVPSPYFLRFMNDALELYKDDDQVACVSGYVYPTRKKLPETFFLRGGENWGWGTWKRAWKQFNPDGKALLKEIEERGLKRDFNFNGAYDYVRMLENQISGKVDSWAIRWHASCFLARRLCLWPGTSLVRNIGFDGTGTNTGITNEYDGELAKCPVEVTRIPLEESNAARKAFEDYFARSKSMKEVIKSHVPVPLKTVLGKALEITGKVLSKVRT
jgi:hypothetical protein